MAKERGGVRNRDEVQDDFIDVSNDIDTKMLPKQVLAELRNISPKAADYVGKHLAAAMMALEDDDSERAYQHSIAARSQGSRLASVREMCGIAAYYNEKWAEALNEFRTYQRITGDPHFMPLMADCERGLGRPEKALNLAKSDQVRSLDADTLIEFRIVISGARADLNQLEAALATLECPELHSKKQSPAITRLRYAYANALQQINRLDEARDWFVKTSLSDAEDLTDAAERAVLISEM
jgi:tetratricopeptide (TPR) repeat protein